MIPSADERFPPPVGVGELAAEVRPRPAVQCPQPPGHPPPHEVAQGAEGVFADGMPEVVGPAAQDLVEPDQHGPWIVLRCPVRQGTDLRLHRPDGPVGDEGVDVPLVRSTFAVPLDAEAQEVEPIAHVHDPGLGSEKRRPMVASTWRDVFAQGVGVVAGCRARGRRNRPHSGRSASLGSPFGADVDCADSGGHVPTRPPRRLQVLIEHCSARCWPAAGTRSRPAGCRCGCPAARRARSGARP